MAEIKISLAAARVNAGLSQEEAAKILRISKKTLQNHEAGKTVPVWETVERYSRLYGIPLDNLFFLPRNSA